MKAPDFLKAGIGHMEDRAKTYDSPEGERSMGATVEAFAAVTGISITEEQGWLFMAMLKAVRSQQGEFRADSYEDGAAYFALAGEAAYQRRRLGLPADEAAPPCAELYVDPMESVPWLPGMRWKVASKYGDVHQSANEKEPFPERDGWVVIGDSAKFTQAGGVSAEWAEKHWKESLRENPDYHTKHSEPAKPVEADPMAEIEWLPGMRWATLTHWAVTFFESGNKPFFSEKDGLWLSGSGWDGCLAIRDPASGFTADEIRRSLRENPEYRNDPKTWEAGDKFEIILGPCSGERITSEWVSHDRVKARGQRVVFPSSVLKLVRRSWENQNA